LKTALGHAVETYGDGLGYTIGGARDYTDHAPFEWEGFQACHIREDFGNPYYHTDDDHIEMPGYIDFAYAHRVTRSVTGWLLESAGLIQSDSVTVLPDGHTLIRGRHILGIMPDLYRSDDSRLTFNPGLTQDPEEPPVWLELTGTSVTDAPTELRFVLETRADTPNITQTISLFNYVTNMYEEVDASTTPFNNDGAVEVTVGGDPSRFINSETLEVKAELTWKPPPLVLVFPWNLGIDQAVWKIVP
jgi:hypothetical protein